MRKFSHDIDAVRHQSKLGYIRHRQSPLWTPPTTGSRDVWTHLPEETGVRHPCRGNRWENRSRPFPVPELWSSRTLDYHCITL